MVRIWMKYTFYIINVKDEMEYKFEAFFTDHMEADQFIRENEEDGNRVLIIAPFPHWTTEQRPNC